MPVLAAAGLVVLAAAAAAQEKQEKKQVFRAGVDVVSLNVTVVDAQNHFVTDLDQGDFTVFEENVRQDILYFSRTSLPIALSLLIDSSASMDERMGTAQEAAIGFARRVRPQDLAQVVDFDSTVEIRHGFTSDVAALEAAIRSTVSGGSTSLYNAVYIALRELAKVKPPSEEELRRQAIVLLSDGEDTTSLVTYEAVLDLAKRSETAIYTIGLQPRDTMGLKGFREAEFVLRQLAQETGGRAFFAQKAEELAGVYEQIAEELSSQYTVGYAPTNTARDGTWRRLLVQVDRPNATARTRRGYYAPSR